MDSRYTVLASGSSGNASLLEVDGFGLLIDCGLPPRTLTHRLAAIGASWNSVHAVILTHTHGDHWKDQALAKFRSQRIPIFAHAAHLNDLNVHAPAFESLHKAGLTRTYREGHELAFGPKLVCRPIPVPHDAEPTFAFRFEARDGQDAPAWSVGFASDLGEYPDGLAEAFAGVDLLAVEYNHDEHMQRSSGRPSFLVNRVLGKYGHLSNVQAGNFTRKVLECSGEETPGFLVQLHLSRQCNTPELALVEARRATAGRVVTVVTARQDVPSRSMPLVARTHRSLTRAARTPVATVHYQPPLPGFGV